MKQSNSSKSAFSKLFAAVVCMLVVIAFVASSSYAIRPPAKGVKMPTIGPEFQERGFGLCSGKLKRVYWESRSKGRSGIEQVTQPPLQGTAIIPVLMGDFSDLACSIPASSFQNQLFSSPPAPSMNAYYNEVSYGGLNVTGTVYSPVTVANPVSYYENGNGGMGPTAFPRNGTGFVWDVVSIADATVDFSQFDNDGPDGVPNSGDDDGIVDVVIVIHAGADAAVGAVNLWSHSWRLIWRQPGASPYQTNDIRAGGGFIQIDDYNLCPEKELSGVISNIGVYCHEFGHACGLPDLYDQIGGLWGIGDWGLMGTGCLLAGGAMPAHLCVWSKVTLGWVTPVMPGPLTGNLPGTVIPDIETSGQCYQLGSGPEYFLVENRQQTNFDANLPGSGLLIWHIDNQIITPNQLSNLVNARSVHGVALECADGLNDLYLQQNNGDVGDPYPFGFNTDFTHWTFPDSRFNTGMGSAFEIRNITRIGNAIQADLNIYATEPAWMWIPYVTDQSGNWDGVVDPGENGALNIDLMEPFSPFYQVTLNNVTGNLTTTDPFITITSGSSTFSQSGSQWTNNQPFTFTAAPNTPLTQQPVFTLTLSATVTYPPPGGQVNYWMGIGTQIGTQNTILLVDDDGGLFNQEGVYQAALNAIGVGFDYWDAWNMMGIPDGSVLRRYTTVIWFTGCEIKNTLGAPYINLSPWWFLNWFLSPGGAQYPYGSNVNLFLCSQDYLWDVGQGTNNVLDNFSQNLLHVGGYTNDLLQPCGQIGLPSDPIGNGLSWTNMAYPFNEFSDDVQTDGLSAGMFSTTTGSNFGAIRYPSTATLDPYKTVFMAFPFEAIPSVTDRTTVMSRILNWFQTDTQLPCVNVSYPDGGETLSGGSTVNIQWGCGHGLPQGALDNVAVASVDLYYSTDGGANFTPIATGIANNGVYPWVVPSISTSQGRVRAVVFDNSGNQNSDLSFADFTITGQFQLVTSVYPPAAPACGTITANPPGPWYNPGTMVTLTANPNTAAYPGVYLAYWSGGVTGTVNPTTVTMNSNMNVVANFTTCPGNVMRGDVNGDGIIDILDAIAVVNHILLVTPLSGNALLWADCNNDGVINVLDALGVVNTILGIGNCVPKGGISPARVWTPEVLLTEEDNIELPVFIDSETDLAGVQVRLSYDVNLFRPGVPRVTDRGAVMKLVSHAENGDLTILVYSLEGSVIPSGSGSVFIVPFGIVDTGGEIGEGSLQFDEVILGGECSESIPVKVRPILLDAKGLLPVQYSLGQNYPNPFNPSTNIKYSVSQPVHATLRVFNVLGQEVCTLVDEVKEPGSYTVTWDAKDRFGMKVACGVYCYTLSVDGGEWSDTKRMVLMK